MEHGEVMLVATAELASTAEAIFSELELSLQESLPESQIEHVGATSMPDGVTKGDVDLNLRVPADRFDETVDVLRGRFDIAQPHNWTSTYASFTDPSRGLPVGLQVTVIGSADDFLVPLRDLLRSDAELRHEYDQVKRDAAALGPDGYWAAKNAFLTEVLARHIPRARRAP
jgi:GrpB-like predicted nucleotidyltransferase (UPF0157 family)